MRFEISMIAVGAAATLLLAASGAQGYAAAAEELPLHLLLALPAAMAVALPHVWVAVYLAGTRRALAREPAAAADLPAARSLGWWALSAAAVALLALVALTATGSRAYSTAGESVLHGALFWVLLAAQPAALLVEWRMLAHNHRLLARHGG